MSSTTPEQRPPTPPQCTICLETRSSNHAILVPCTHTFDLSCIHHYLTNFTRSPTSRICPICRQPITAIRYNFTSSGTCDTHTFSATQPETPLLSGPFIAADEELRVEMSPEERGRVLELRRLRRIDDYVHQFFSLCREKAWCIASSESGPRIVFAQKSAKLRIKQTNDPATVAHLSRLIKIETFEAFDVEAWANKLGPQKPEAVEGVRKEARGIIAGVAEFRESWREVVVESPVFRTEWDERGLSCVTNTTTKIRQSNGGEVVIIERMKKLCEGYDAASPGTVDGNDGIVEGVGKEEREEKVRLMREEVQGILEHVTVVTPGWRGLERASTGILEPVPAGREEGCEYCGKKHRNGDCHLPEFGVIELESIEQ